MQIYNTRIPPPIRQGYIKIPIGSKHDSVIGSAALSNLSSPVLLSFPAIPQLQLHENKSAVLQRRKGGKLNWIECNSVHRAGNESIMLRNGFGRTECTPWVRGSFCLSGPSCLCILQQANQEAQCSPLCSRCLFLWCLPFTALQNISCLFVRSSNRSAWIHISVDSRVSFSSLSNVFTDYSWAYSQAHQATYW